MKRAATFGSIVKERRYRLDLTQAELARRANCAAITIRKIESDALRPSVQIAQNLAVALNIPKDEHLAFVRLARAEREPDPIPAPEPVAEEIGQADLTGRALRGFELGKRLGTGGYGVVYRATQPSVGREVAIKIILPNYADRPEFIRRFEAEAQLVARLEHPHIVPLYDYWREPGKAYLVMRLLPGGNLAERLKKGPQPPEAILPLMEQLCLGLHTAHRAGVVHRDIKPSNILLDTDGNAYLADFGIAKPLGSDTSAEMTGEGDVVGSPAYISPEQILAEPVGPQTDIYSLGILLYELLSGRKPFQGTSPFAYVQQHLKEPMPLLATPDRVSAAAPVQNVRAQSSTNSALPTALDVVIGRATAKDPRERYPDSLAMLTDLRQALRPGSTVATLATTQARSAEPAHVSEMLALPDLENPYKGLRPFTEADAGDFFGRETLIQELLTRLSEANELARFLAVVGPSGSGKSSAVRAGLLSTLRQGGLPGSEQWFITEMVPGSQPLAELEAALLRVAITPPPDLLAQLEADERGLLRTVRQILPANRIDGEANTNEPTELLLLIDQFEEIFTLVQTEKTRVHFLNSIVTAILDPASRLRVVITLRADFIDQSLQYVDFGDLVRQRSAFVLPLTPDELEQAIIGPTERAGLVLEPELTPTIIRDIGEQPGMLPLLQYALTELFERRNGRLLTLSAHQESGGVLGALARRADELYNGLDDTGRRATRQLFSRLVTLGEGTEDTRRRVLRSELISLDGAGAQGCGGAEERRSRGEIQNPKPVLSEVEGSKIQNVIDLFGHYRLLTFDHDPVTRGPTVEVAHEALIREWSRLRHWVDEDREFLLWQQRLRAGLHQWEASEYDEGALLRGAPLAEAENWFSQRQTDLNETERNFIRASLELRERREAKREAQRQRELEAARKLAETEAQAAANLRRRAVWLAGAGIVAVLLAIAATLFGMQARQNAQEALDAQQAAEREARRAKAGQRVVQAQTVLDNDEDPSGGLPLLLAREAVLTTLIPDGYFTIEADTVLRQAIEAVPRWRMILPHPNTVNSVAFSPDGQRIITAGGDGFVRVWDVRTGEEVVTSYRHSTGQLNSVTFSPDGKMIAMVGEGGFAELRDAALTGQTLRSLKGHTTSVLWAAFSPDGKTLITTGQEPDSIPRLWDVDTGQEIHRLQGQPRRINQAVFSPDGKTIATSGHDQTARLWDLSTGEEIQRFAGGHTDVVVGVAFSPDGQTIVTTGFDKTVRLWDLSTGEEIRQFIGHTDAVYKPAFSPDGKTIVTTSQDSTVRLWDVATGAEMGRLTAHTAHVNMADFSPDGQTIATASNDQTVRLWDAVPNERHDRLEHLGEVESIAIDPRGQTIVTASNLRSGEARLLDLQTGQEIHRLEGHIGQVTAVGMSPDGQTIVTAGSDKTIRLWDTATGEEIMSLEGHEDFIFDIAFSPDGQSIVTASADRTARLWEVASGQEIIRFEGHTNQVRSAAFSPDGKTVVTTGGFGDPTARLWDVTTGAEIRAFEGHTDILNSAHFSPDGQMIVTASGDGTVRLWAAATGQEVRQFEGHSRNATSAIFSPDGQSIVTTGFDRMARVWEVASGAEIRRLEGHTASVNAAIFTPDGQSIITASDDNTVRVWPSLEQLLDLAESLIQRDPPEFTPEERLRFGLGE